MNHVRPSRAVASFREERDEIDAALRADAEGLYRDLFGEPDPATLRRAEWKFPGFGGLFAVVRSVGRKRRGDWYLHSASRGGDPLAAIRFAHNCSFPEAVAFARERLGLVPGAPIPAPSAKLVEARAREQAARAAETAAADLKAIEDARRIWNVTVRLPGTLGDRYLREIRRIDAELPSSVVRWHPIFRAVVLAATDDAGEIRAIQLIHVGPDGRKLSDAESRKLRSPETNSRPADAKWTRGRLRDAWVRLPGSPDGPLQLAEGPETGLSVWAATSHETWITLGVGGFKRVVPPPGRLIVLCRDDDPNVSRGAQALRSAEAVLREGGASLIIATPWSARRFDGTDFNDVAQEQGLVGVAARIGTIIEAPARVMRRQLPALSASEIVETAIVAHYSSTWSWNVPESESDDAPSPIVDVVRATVGISKSSVARSELLRHLRRLRLAGDKRNVAIAVPSHRLGAEAETLLRALAGEEFRVRVWRGYGADDPERPGHNMCDDLAAVGDALAAGTSVQEACCSYKPKGRVRIRCPFFDECGAQRQRADRADIWIVAHELIFAEKPAALGELAALVVDEAAWQDGLEGVGARIVDGVPRHSSRHTLSLDALTETDRRPGEVEDPSYMTLAYTRGRALDALRREEPGAVSRLVLADISAAEAMEARGLELSRLSKDTGLRPGMSRKERQVLVEASSERRTILNLARFWDAVATLRADDGPERSGWVELATVAGEHGPQRVLFLKGRREIAKGWRVPTLVLDANADLDLLRPYWPNARMVVDIDASAPHQHIRQVADRSFAKHKFAPLDAEAAEARPEIEASRRRKRRSLRDMIAREARQTSDGRLLAVMQADVENGVLALGLRPGVETAHHNNIAGRDIWRAIERMVVAGRTMPPPRAVELMAEALTGIAIAPSKYERRDAWRLVRGRLVACQSDQHPNPIAERIRWQVCEGELIQIIGRPRGIWRTAENPVDILLATDVALPVNVDEEIAADNLAPSPTEQMLGAGGIAFENCRHASAAYQDIWPKAKDAENATRRWPRTPSFSDKDSIYLRMRESSARSARVRYRLAGAGQKMAEATVDLVHCPDPRRAVEQALSSLGLLAEFEIVGAPEPDLPVIISLAIENPVTVPPLASEPGIDQPPGEIPAATWWAPPPGYFDPLPSAIDRAILRIAGALPWRVSVKPGERPPDGWRPTAWAGGP